MRTGLALVAILALALGAASTPSAERLVPVATGPSLTSIGPLYFSPDGTLYAADTRAATIYALDLGGQRSGSTPGTQAVAGIDQRIASALGTAPNAIAITDLAVEPKSHNAFISVMRGQGPDAQPALVRVDGSGRIDVVSLDAVKYTNVTLPNPAAVNPNGRGGRTQSVTDMSLIGNRLFVAGLSNEEFASKLWSVTYPFATADRGTSVEIYHGNHSQFETRSPIMTFLPYTVGGQQVIVAGYTCTPLVTFPLSDLKTGEKIVGRTMMDLGAGNQPTDMIQYAKDGKDYLLIANSAHGIVKVPTAQFATLPAITAHVDTAGSFEKIPSMPGVDQLALLDAQHAATISHAPDGTRSLGTPALP